MTATSKQRTLIRFYIISILKTKRMTNSISFFQEFYEIFLDILFDISLPLKDLDIICNKLQNYAIMNSFRKAKEDEMKQLLRDCRARLVSEGILVKFYELEQIDLKIDLLEWVNK